ncbi:MAG: glycerol-3-phosphate dehydrogenase [Rhodobacterales bacterium]|nr:MAG: glycerol-3-phosphate dehydrogenase [Rhodobacterales bacterium]
MTRPDHEITDVFVIGGGINGCGIARDAVGRGYSVMLAEKGDLASATSSASTKLFHGGLRYLEYLEVSLVRSALREREALLKAMPHISWPMRFVLPYHKDMRFETDTPVSRLLRIVMPWTKGRRPAWIVRLGLFFYDHLGARELLPGTTRVDLHNAPEGAPLDDRFARAFEYSDCWVDDSRLVVLNARDAAARGARILTRSEVVAARREGDLWKIETQDTDTGARAVHHARLLVNAAGPWVEEVVRGRIGIAGRESVRLVRGSHIVTRRLFDHDKSYFFQGTDGRIAFAIPYEADFTLIGTTDADHASPDQTPRCSEEERRYLIDFVNGYLAAPISEEDVVWSYSGVRSLYDDGASNASATTRDYVFGFDEEGGAPVLSVFGGKITTYRKLAEAALDRIGSALGPRGAAWTGAAPLPGGDFPVDGVPELVATLCDDYPFLTVPWAQRLVRAYGIEARTMLGAAQRRGDLGHDFGGTLTEAELVWLRDREFARSGEDVLWRRGKLGLRLTPEQADEVAQWMVEHRQGAQAAAD